MAPSQSTRTLPVSANTTRDKSGAIATPLGTSVAEVAGPFRVPAAPVPASVDTMHPVYPSVAVRLGVGLKESVLVTLGVRLDVAVGEMLGDAAKDSVEVGVGVGEVVTLGVGEGVPGHEMSRILLPE